LKLKHRIITCGAVAAYALLLASCSEKLQTEAACPILCPDQTGTVQNVTLDAATLDTTVSSISGIGTESGLLIASRGDSLDTRAIIRFDSIPARFQPTAADTTTKAVTEIDSAFLALQLDTASLKVTDPVTIEAYDVDTTYTDAANADTSTAIVLRLFRPDRFISKQSFTKAQLTDTLHYLIKDSVVLAKAKAGGRLRIGLRAVSTASTQIRVLSMESGFGARLSYRVSTDTTIHPFLVTPYSRTPTGATLLAANLSDYTLIAKSPAPAPPNTLNLGGLPPTRVYVRFNIPSVIVDSSTVVRAAMILTQFPNRAIDPKDSVSIEPSISLAAIAVTDPARASQILASINLSPVRIAVGDSGVRAIEIAPAFILWHLQKADDTPRAVVLRSLSEGLDPLALRFFSLEAPAALRPKLQISYIRKSSLGLP
jgi:hypothetical protein